MWECTKRLTHFVACPSQNVQTEVGLRHVSCVVSQTAASQRHRSSMHSPKNIAHIASSDGRTDVEAPSGAVRGAALIFRASLPVVLGTSKARGRPYRAGCVYGESTALSNSVY